MVRLNPVLILLSPLSCLLLGLMENNFAVAFTHGTFIKTQARLNANKHLELSHSLPSKLKRFENNGRVSPPSRNVTIKNLKRTSSHLRSSSGGDVEEGTDTPLVFRGISIPYATAWVGFIYFGLLYAPNHFTGVDTKDMINQIVANPLNPGLNEMFMFVFSLFTFIPLTLSALILPGSNNQKLPATPFLLGSSLVGYFALGPYMSTRKAVFDVKKEDLGWFTRTILENKLFNWAIFLLSVSSMFTTGLYSGLISNPSDVLEGFRQLFVTSQFASASTVDICLLTITAASLIPEDLQRRGVSDGRVANVIAASTVLVPVIGSALYCALRPSLEDE